MAGEILILSNQNRQLKFRVNFLNQSLLSLSLQPGDYVSTFAGKDLRGNTVIIDYKNDNKKTVLLAFSTECHICEKNIPFWNHLFDIANPDSYRVIGVSKNDIEDIKQFVEEFNIKFPVLYVDDISFWWRYKLFRLPQTIVITKMQIGNIWQGILSNKAKRRIMDLIE